MLTCLKIVASTYYLYVDFMIKLGLTPKLLQEVNNCYVLKDGSMNSWEWIMPEDFMANYKWVSDRASFDGWTPVERINADLDLL